MSENIISNYQSDLELLRSSAVAAGIVALGYFSRDIKSWTKDNTSPVTEADFLVDNLLQENLLSARKNYGWLSEESADNLVRLKKQYCFIIDPIDGTRAFMRGDDCWSISLAIVKDSQPVAGVIYAPARDELYYASKGSGAYLNGEKLVRMAGVSGRRAKQATAARTRISKQRYNNEIIIPAPPAVHRELKANGLKYTKGPIYPSLAYRLVQVATGKIDVAIARRGAQDWDIAAADVILQECGLKIEDVCVGVPKYNKQEIRHGALAVFSDLSIKAQVCKALIKVYGCPNINDKLKESTNE